jgi:hypothetical protein
VGLAPAHRRVKRHTSAGGKFIGAIPSSAYVERIAKPTAQKHSAMRISFRT